MSNRAASAIRTFERALHDEMVRTIKGLAMDAVEAAGCGHPGMPMGAAGFASVLWSEFLVHDPAQPSWPDRDRFVLSAGHGSMLLYSLLHLTGYELSLDELRAFRQWDSRTPGHPEWGHTAGVDVTTGPLGTGFAAGVGMALAERLMAARYNQPGHTVVDHMTYGIVSDGDLMEGVAAESASLAGHLGLGKLVYLYDQNRITIDGSTDLAFTEDVPRRFEAYGWQVQSVDGHDPQAVREALVRAIADEARPSLIACRTIIGHGAPTMAGTAATHGAKLGAAEVAATKRAMGWPEASFHVPARVTEALARAGEHGRAAARAWQKSLVDYRREHRDLAAELERVLGGELPSDLAEQMPRFESGTKVATRKVSGKVLASLAARLPELVGGSADLAGSNCAEIPNSPGNSRDVPAGRNLHFGVREHGMAGVCNGIALHGGLRPFDATFLVFSDFMRGALRLSALMGLPVVHVFTHDSIWLGEDGPTHQPIEHTMSLRLIPNLDVVRPADARETVGAWLHALARREGPTAILLTRQDVPTLEGSQTDVSRGAYVVFEPAGAGALDGILVATGSEVALAVGAASALATRNRRVRVVSMPCWEAFERQARAYRDEVLPPGITRRLAVEAGATLGWDRYARAQHGRDAFGASAPAEVLAERFGFTVDAVVAHYLALDDV